MKKIISIVLSVMMVAGLFVSLIPVVSAKPATMAEPGLLVYSEDFEGDNLTGKTDNALTQALGWKQWNDEEYTVEGYMSGLNGRGVASIVEANGSTAIQMTYKGQGGIDPAYGDAYGWGVQVVENDRLAGGDYIIEYTANIVSETDSGSARGIGWRNNRCYGYDPDWITEGATAANTGATYHVQIKSTGAYDMHLKATNGTTYTTADSSSAGLGSVIGLTNTYRTVVSSTEGVHTYVLKDGVWTYYFGMNADAITQFGKDASNIGAGLILRVCKGVTVNFDDIAVYTIKDENTPAVAMEGFQTTVAENDIYDLRLIGSVSDKTDVKYTGFIVSVNGGAERKVYLRYAYRSLTVNYGSGSVSAPDNGFLGALEINNCPLATKFTAKFFIEYEDGATLISDKLAVSYPEDPIVFNEVDQMYIEKAIKILSKSTFTGQDFAKHAYTVAYSKPNAITSILSGTPEEMMEQVSAPDEALAPAIAYANGDTFVASDLVSGDLLFVKANDATKLYMVCADELYDITATAVKASTATVLNDLATADSYAVVRPSLTMTYFTPSDPDETAEEMNAYQEALVKTAETFLLRGENLQYEDVWFGLTNTSGEHRWTHGQKAPEEYTIDEWGYINCAVFTYEVYRNALGYELPNNMYTTANLAANAETLGMLEYHFENATPGQYTDEYIAQIREELMNTLQIGDLIVVRRSNSAGHVVMYVGNGRFIHSSGSSYYKDSAGVGHEVYEPTVRYQKIDDYFFNPTTAYGYLFRGADDLASWYVQNLYVVRPLNAFSGEIPEATVARIENMQDIRADKLSSHPSSVSVNPGENITFTFSLFNVGETAKTIDIFDKVPTGTTYVSGCDNVSGDELRWTVTVGAGETVTVSYVVKVNEDTADGTLIDGRDATIGGVAHRCAAIRVKRTLTAEEQAAIQAAIEALKSEGTTLTKLELVNEIYKNALSVENIFADTDVNNVVRDGDESIFAVSSVTNGTNSDGSYRYLSKLRTDETYYSSMLVDHLYGGIRFDSSEKLYDRTKLLKTHNLVVGDILIARTLSAEYVFIYAGDGNLLSLSSGVGAAEDFVSRAERLMYYGRDFAVVRPSYVMEY